MFLLLSYRFGPFSKRENRSDSLELPLKNVTHIQVLLFFECVTARKKNQYNPSIASRDIADSIILHRDFPTSLKSLGLS